MITAIRVCMYSATAGILSAPSLCCSIQKHCRRIWISLFCGRCLRDEGIQDTFRCAAFSCGHFRALFRVRNLAYVCACRTQTRVRRMEVYADLCCRRHGEYGAPVGTFTDENASMVPGCSDGVSLFGCGRGKRVSLASCLRFRSRQELR